MGKQRRVELKSVGNFVAKRVFVENANQFSLEELCRTQYPLKYFFEVLWFIDHQTYGKTLKAVWGKRFSKGDIFFEVIDSRIYSKINSRIKPDLHEYHHDGSCASLLWNMIGLQPYILYFTVSPCHKCPAYRGYSCIRSPALSCYKYYNKSDLKYGDSRQQCIDDGGALMRIDSAKKQKLAEDILGFTEYHLFSCLKLTCHHINRRHICFNINSVSVHPLLWMNVMLDFICMVLAELGDTLSFWIFRLHPVDNSSANTIQMKSSMTFIQSNGWMSTEIYLIL